MNKLSIYSAHGIAIKDTLDGDGVQESIELDNKTINILSTEDINLTSENYIKLDTSRADIRAIYDLSIFSPDIYIVAPGLDIQSDYLVNIDASRWDQDVSNFILNSRKNITCKAASDVSILYKNDFQVKNVSDNKGSYLKMGYDSFIISATGVRISSPEDVSITSKRLYYYYKNGTVISTVDADSSNYLIKLET
jgi:hypothetical protein